MVFRRVMDDFEEEVVEEVEEIPHILRETLISSSNNGSIEQSFIAYSLMLNIPLSLITINSNRNILTIRIINNNNTQIISIRSFVPRR